MTKQEAHAIAWEAWRDAILQVRGPSNDTGPLIATARVAFASWWRDREKSKRVRSG